MSSENNVTLETYKKVIDSMPYGMIVADTKGKFILWNEKAHPVLNDHLSKSLQENWVNEFGVFELDKTTKFKTEDLPMSKALNGQICDGEKMFVKHPGLPEGIYLKVSSFPIKDEHTIIAGVIMFEDITKEQKLYDNIITKINELELYLRDLLILAHTNHNYEKS